MKKALRVLSLMMALALIVCAVPALAEQTAKSEFGVKYAKQMNIEYLDDGVKIIADADGRQYLLVPEGVEAPAEYAELTAITTPVQKPMFCSTTEVGALDALNVPEIYDRIGAVTTAVEYWTIDEVVERLNDGRIQFIDKTHDQGPNIELVQQLQPDIVINSAGDQSGVDFAAQMEDLGINYITDSAWLEDDEYAQLEWIKLFAALYNLDQEAHDFFENTINEIAALEDIAASVTDRPVVAYGLLYDGVVYTYGNQSVIARKIERAGGVYALSDLEGTGSMQVSLEEFVAKCKDADILIYDSQPKYSGTIEQMIETEPLMATFKAYKNGMIYQPTQDFYMASAEVAAKFKDLVKIFQPEILPDWELAHYQLMQ